MALAASAALTVSPSGGRHACRTAHEAKSFTLGSAGQLSSLAEGEGDGEGDGESDATEALPFAASIGGAIVTNKRFWVTAIDPKNGGSHAILARIEETVDSGAIIDLGRVYGDAEPPKIVVQGSVIWLAVGDADAAGKVLKIGRLSIDDPSAKVEWQDTVAEGADDSPVFSLVANESTVLIAWDELEPKTRRGIVRFRRVGAGDSVENRGSRSTRTLRGGTKDDASQKAGNRVESTPKDLDAEAPQLVRRPGGFWLAYLAAESKKAANLGSDRQPASNGKSEESAGDRPVVELGRRGVQVLPLDEQGRIGGQPIAVTEPSSHVVAFEIDSLPDGSAVVAYRDEDSSPGVEADAITVAKIRLDGGVTRLRRDDTRLGVGAPFLLGASETNHPEPVWIAVAGKSGDTAVFSYQPNEERLGEVVTEPLLLGAEPIARTGSALLIARSRGQQVEFERLECSFLKKP